MSKHEFDETRTDTDQMFDFLDDEAVGNPARKQRTRSKKEFVMPIIRKPVPISQSGAASVSMVSNASSFDDDFDFLNDKQAQGSTTVQATSQSQTVTTNSASEFGANWHEGIHEDHEDNHSALVKKLLFMVAGIATAALLLLVVKVFFQPTDDAVANPDTAGLAVTSADSNPTTSESESFVAPTLGQQFFTQLETIETYVAAGELDAAEQAIASLDRAVYGYGAPEFTQIEEQIAQLRSGAVVNADTALEITADENAQQAAEAARVAEEAKAAEIARVEEARAAEAARVAEEAKAAEAARLAEEARAAEAARVAEEARAAEAARVAEEARAAEAARVAEEARAAEAARVAEEARTIEAARVAELARAAEEARFAEATRAANEALRLEEQQRAEQQAAFVRAEQAQVARAEREAARLVEAEAARLAEAKRLQEVANANAQVVERQRLAALRRAEARDRIAAQAQAEADAQKAAQARLLEIENEKRIAERARINEEKARADEIAREQRRQQQTTPITDLEFNAVSARFFELKKAIEREDIEAVIALTQPSQSRVQDMLQLFANNASIKVRLGNVTSRNVNGGIVEGELSIEKLNAPLKVSSQRDSNSWSLIKW